MTSQKNTIIDVEPVTKPGRKGDGGTYLVVADDSPEFGIALRYAARAAQSRRGHVGIIHVIEMDEFQQWGMVEARMRAELRQQAEQYIWSAAKTINELTGERPSLYITEGSRNDALAKAIAEDSQVVTLVLGAGGSNDPLVSYFTGKGIGAIAVPVLVVPGHLEPEAIDALT